MTELGVRELVQTTGTTDGEVTPDVGVGTEVQFLKGTGRGLESSIWILGSDTDGNDVALRTGLSLKLVGFGFDHVKVDFRIAARSDPIELTDMLDAVERKTHGNLELSGGKVDSGNHFCGRMLDLETGVELEEVEDILRMAVEIWTIRGSGQRRGLEDIEGLTLDSSGADISDKLGQTNGSTLHFLESILLCNGHGGFFNDLLVTTLDGTIATEERDRVSILISQ